MRSNFPLYDCKLILGFTNEFLLYDLRALEGMCKVIRSLKYSRDCPLKNLKVITETLNAILLKVVRKCKSFRTGVLCSIAFFIFIHKAFAWGSCSF